MITSFSDLIPLLPLLVVTATVVVTMIAIGIKRSYVLSAALTIIGLLLAAITTWVLFDSEAQVTPLIIIDQYSQLFILVSCLTAMAIAILSFPYFFELPDDKDEYYLLLGLATIGAIVMVSSNHFISLLLGVETLSMSLYGMVAYPLHSKDTAKYPLEAALKYLVLSAAASAIMLFGIALIYAQTGSLSFVALPIAEFQGLAIIAVLLLLAGIAFKLSLAPFHLWTPDVYEGAPLPATSYLATLGKVAMFVVLLRYVEASAALSASGVVAVLSLIAVLSIVLGNLLALLQANLKRILAYSSIAHMGYVLIALIAGATIESSLAIEAVTFYLVAYCIMTLGAFGVVSVVSSSEKEFDVVFDYRGLFWREPWLAAIFTAMLLSLAGIPLTVGFIGKFYLFFVAVEAELWGLLAAMVIGSGIGLYYYLRIVYRMLMPPKGEAGYREAGMEGFTSYAVLGVLLMLLLGLGIYPAPLITVIQAAALF